MQGILQGIIAKCVEDLLDEVFCKEVHFVKFTNQNGFLLIGMIFMMVLLAVMAIAMNQRAGLQQRIAANHSQSIQNYASQIAATEKAIWELTKDPCWRTTAEGEQFIYSGVTHTRKVLNSSIGGYEDALTISVSSPGVQKPLNTSIRYYIYSPSDLEDSAPRQVCVDHLDNFYVADKMNHKVLKRDFFSGEVVVVAGTGTAGDGGDGGPATEAQLDNPCSVAVDLNGNIYIADTYNDRIRRVDAVTGIIETVAGTGDQGYNGDDIDATTAWLDTPYGVAVDDEGNFYIADAYNHRIRKVDTSGTITTVAGTGVSGWDGDGAATSKKLFYPYGVFVDVLGEIYIADTFNHIIRKVDAARDMTTVAGEAEDFGYEGDGGRQQRQP